MTASHSASIDIHGKCCLITRNCCCCRLLNTPDNTSVLVQGDPGPRGEQGREGLTGSNGEPVRPSLIFTQTHTGGK